MVHNINVAENSSSNNDVNKGIDKVDATPTVARDHFSIPTIESETEVESSESSKVRKEGKCSTSSNHAPKFSKGTGSGKSKSGIGSSNMIIANDTKQRKISTVSAPIFIREADESQDHLSNIWSNPKPSTSRDAVAAGNAANNRKKIEMDNGVNKRYASVRGDEYQDRRKSENIRGINNKRHRSLHLQVPSSSAVRWKAGQEVYKEGNVVGGMRRVTLSSGKGSLDGSGSPDTDTVGYISESAITHYQRTRYKTAMILLQVTVVFLITWAPFWILYVIGYLNEGFWDTTDYVSFNVWRICRYLYLVNHAINPVIYAFGHKQFRNDLKAVLKKVCCRTNH